MDGYESRWRTLFILFVLFLLLFPFSSSDLKVGVIALFIEFLLDRTDFVLLTQVERNLQPEKRRGRRG